LNRYYTVEYYGNRHAFTDWYCNRRRVRLVERASGRRGRLLDVGCGDGQFLAAARKSGWSVAGTEISPEAARARGLDVFESLAEAEKLAPYDCVTFWHSLEHLRDPRPMMEGAYSLLASSGVVIVAVPDADGIQARFFGPGWFHLDVPRHLYHFGNRSLTLLLESLGFLVRKRWHLEVELDAIGWSQSMLNRLNPVPNAFFDAMRGRRPHLGYAALALNVVSGTLLSMAAVPITWVTSLLHRGGTLIVAATKA
jgi:SAM-dependent methyltransferase